MHFANYYTHIKQLSEIALAKTALLIDLIELLRARPGVTIDTLASNLGRSPRTVYRWLGELHSEIGISVNCNCGGYYLVEEPSSSSHNLTAEELVAVHAAMCSLTGGGQTPLRSQMESAWLKIKECASGRALEFSRELAGGYDIRFTVTQGSIPAHIPCAIENAISQRKQLHIVYRSQKSNKVKEYTIDPYVLVFRRHSWYMVAYSHEHNKIVMFKLLRFRDACITDVKFEMPRDFSVQDYFKYSWEAWGGGEPTLVRVKFSPEVAEMVAEARRHHTQQVQWQPDGGIIFEATVGGIHEIAIWLLGFGKEAEVIEPQRLRNFICEQAQGMAITYETSDLLMPLQTASSTAPLADSSSDSATQLVADNRFSADDGTDQPHASSPAPQPFTLPEEV